MTARLGNLVVLLGVALLGMMLGISAPAMADARVALVIGNGDYEGDLGKLRNPVNDATLMADTLRELGFDVDLVANADQKEMKRAIRDFGQKLRGTGGNGIGLFFYAGHGVQVDGENYLLPIGAQIAAEGDVELEAVSATSVLSQMQFAGNAVNLVFLDACRNNPLTRNFRSGARGLARVDAPRGSFVGYSTAPGDISVDGSTDNSPYTLALVEALRTPGTSIEEAHRAVRAKVLAATNQRQTPWDSSSLTGPVILAKATESAPPAAAIAPAPAPVAPAVSGGGASQQAELLFWDSIKDSDNPATFEAYLKQFPSGVFVGLAQAKLDELKAKSGATDTIAAQQAETQVAPAETQSAAIAPEPAPIVIEPMSGVYVAKKSVNLRAAPDTKSTVLGKLAVDQAADVTGEVAGGDWLRVAYKGKEAFVSAGLMARSSAAEIAAWQALQGQPSAAGAQSFLEQYPDGPFQPKAKALLAKLQQPAEAAPAVVAQPSPAPAPTQQAAVTPAPARNVIRISAALRDKVERYLNNSESFGGYYRYLAVNAAGDKIGTSSCRPFTSYFQDPCGGASNPKDGAKRIALKECGRPSECRLIFEGAKKIGDFEIEWY